ncbi:MAG: DUF4294 domain-containing protein [Saprospiraceae bacterium]
MYRLPFFLSLFFLTAALTAQQGYTRVGTDYFAYTVNECGDTLILASLEGVSVSSPRAFASREDELRYRKYRRYAIKVYPYAREAIRIFRETEYVTQHMKSRERKRYIRKLQKELDDEFKEPLKKLSKTQGLILMKMIERELDRPMFDLVQDLRGGLTASYWGTLSRFYGYRMKDGYIVGDDKILDSVLDDFNVAYQVPATSIVTRPVEGN